MATALDLIQGAMKLLGVLSPDAALTSGEQSDGLTALNDLLEGWALNPTNVHKPTLSAVVTLGDNPHTLGSGGDWDLPRPIRVDAIQAQISTGEDRAVTLIGWEDYAAIRLKGLATDCPEFAYIANDYPLTKVYLYPVPAAGMQLSIWTIQPLQSFAATSTTVSLPPGYVKAIKENLAVAMAPSFGIPVSADLGRMAAASLRQIQRLNVRVPTLQVPPGYDMGRGTGASIWTNGR